MRGRMGGERGGMTSANGMRYSLCELHGKETTPLAQFGKLEFVDLREAWGHEAHDFTPWLANNLDLLAETMGMDGLELVGREVYVSGFRADILAQDSRDNSHRVLIENQLEYSDHTHLRQILSYWAGLEAQTVVWIARDFWDEHIDAIRRLNERTVEPFAFLAIIVRVAKIGDSDLAPVFDVVEKPNWWDSVRNATRAGSSDLSERRAEFWRNYNQLYPNDHSLGDVHRSANVRIPVESVGLRIVLCLLKSGAGIYVDGKRGEDKNAVFERLQRFKNRFKERAGRSLGAPGDWHCEQYSPRMDMIDRANWRAAADWLHEKLALYREILSQPDGRE